jgi:hypothetical protein
MNWIIAHLWLSGIIAVVVILLFVEGTIALCCWAAGTEYLPPHLFRRKRHIDRKACPHES